MKTDTDFIELTSLSWDEATLSFSVAEMCRVRVDAVRPRKERLAESVEFNTVGRLRLAALRPATNYEVVVRWGRQQRTP